MEIGEGDIGEGLGMEKRNVRGWVKGVIEVWVIVEGGKVGGS